MHVLDPVTAEYVPAAQFTQVAEEVAPKAVEYMPAEHCRQTVEAVALEYVPALQFVQVVDTVAPRPVE